MTQNHLSPATIIIVVMAYFGLLMFVAYLTARKSNGNSDFFMASRRSKWYIVAFGMIGSSVSGISLVAVPAMVQGSAFGYLQMSLGFVVGYILVATLLLPIYYKRGVTSIYAYLNERFGSITHKTSAYFFIISKIITSASKLYVAVLVLQQFVFASLGVPLWLTVFVIVAMIWLYTFKGGIKTIVLTDAIQSLVLIVAIVAMLINMAFLLGENMGGMFRLITDSSASQVFFFDNIFGKQHFAKQFISGIFVVVAMTGISQDMMQTTLSCSSLREAQKNMLVYGSCFVPFNLLLLSIGASMILFANKEGVLLPSNPNALVPMFASQYMMPIIGIIFVIGIIAATFNSADSTLTSIATIFCVDILQESQDNEAYNIRIRNIIYLCVCIIFGFVIMAFDVVKNKSLLDTIYTIVGYAYGPLLGLFGFGLFTKWQIRDKFLPVVAIVSPFMTYFITLFIEKNSQYRFNYEILILNAIIMFVLMLLIKKDNR